MGNPTSAVNFEIVLQKSSRLVMKLSRALSKTACRIYQSPHQRNVARWVADSGDKTLRLDYDLNEHSLVLDLGGYEGQWASDIFARYCCVIHVFEPVYGFASQIERRFSRNEKIVIHQFGLAADTKTASITLDGDGSSLFGQVTTSELIQLVKAIDFMKENSIDTVDLMKINIEGGEYDLLEHLIACGFVRCIKNIQVQFHTFVPDAAKRMSEIQKGLAATHSLTYQYPFVWENWRKRESV
jgi:FkbM family methyltransferase